MPKYFEVIIEGTAPILFHAFGTEAQIEVDARAKKATVKKDYSGEWRDTLYLLDGGKVSTPSEHILAAMIAAAVNFKMGGKGRKTYKDFVKANISITPAMIPHKDVTIKSFEKAPVGNIFEHEGKKKCVIDKRPVVVNRARVLRHRAGLTEWKLEFEIECIDDDITTKALQDILEEAGKKVGIGDWRPRCGRFRIVEFKEIEKPA